MPETEHNWARICSEIVVAAYGTRIVGEKDGWPLCVYPLEECRDDGSGTLHTYKYDAVPDYRDVPQVGELKCYLTERLGWAFGSRSSGSVAGGYLAWVNKPPLAPRGWLRKGSITAAASVRCQAMALAIHKALMTDG